MSRTMPEQYANAITSQNYPMTSRDDWQYAINYADALSYSGNDYVKRIHYAQARDIIKTYFKQWLEFPTKYGMHKTYGISENKLDYGLK